jgi:hypothetical protein
MEISIFRYITPCSPVKADVSETHIFDLADGGDMFLLNVAFTRLHGVISQKTAFYLKHSL